MIVHASGLTRVVVIALALVNLVAGGSRSAAQEAITIFDVAGTHFDWIADEGSGRIFGSVVVADEKGAVIEFDPTSGKELRRFDVGSNPSHLTIKGTTLVVADRLTTRLDFIDLKANRVAGKLQLAGGWAVSLFCSKVDNPYVYAAWAIKRGARNCTISQIDVTTRKVRKQVETERWRREEPADVAMSPDGTLLVFGEGSSSPSGANLMDVDEGECRFVQRLNYHHSYGPKQAGPSGRFWTMGGELWPLDLQSHIGEYRHDNDDKPLRTFDAGLLALHPNRDLAVGIKSTRATRNTKASRKLVFFKFGTAEAIKSLPLAGSGDKAPTPPTYPVLWLDAERQRVFHGHGNRAEVLDLSKLELPDDPLVLLNVPLRVSAAIGKELRLPLQLANAEQLGKATLKLISGPDGAKIEGGALVWTPTDSDVGVTPCVVEAVVGGASDRAPVGISVERAPIALGGALTGLSVSPDGSRALAILHSDEVRELVLVDLEAAKVLKRRSFAKPLAHVLLTETAGYYSAEDAALLTAVDTSDLTDAGRCFLAGQPRSLRRLPGGRIAAFAERSVQLVDEKTRQVIETPPEVLRDFGSGTSGLIVPSNGAVRVGTRAYDSDTGEFLYHVRPQAGHANMPISRRWNRQVQDSGIYINRDNRLARWEGTPSTLLPNHPAAVSVRYESLSNPAGGAATVKLSLEFRKLTDGALLPRYVLANAPPPQIAGRSSHDYRSGKMLKIVAEGDRVVVGVWDKLFAVKLPEDLLADLPVPLHFSNKVKVPELAVDGSAKVAVSASGGKAPYTFSLAKEVPGIAIDSKSGELALDGAEAWASVTEKLKSGGLHAVMGPYYRDPTPPDHFWIDTTLAVIDAENAKDLFPLSVKLIVDRAKVLALIKPKPQPPVVAVAPKLVKPANTNTPGIASGGTASPGSPQVAVQIVALQERLAVSEALLANLGEKLDAVGSSLKSAVQEKGEQSGGGGGGTVIWIVATLAAAGLGLFVGRNASKPRTATSGGGDDR